MVLGLGLRGLASLSARLLGVSVHALGPWGFSFAASKAKLYPKP